MSGRRGRPDAARRADRGLSPVVGKALELGIVVLFVALLTTTFYGDVVPGYRTAAAAEVGDRAIVDAADAVEDAVPERTASVDRRVAVSLPATIRGDAYRVRAVSAANDTDGNGGGGVTDERATALVLDHPDGGVGGRTTLTFPARTVTVSGTWRSETESWVVVRGEGGRIAVRLANGAAGEATPDVGPEGGEP